MSLGREIIGIVLAVAIALVLTRLVGIDRDSWIPGVLAGALAVLVASSWQRLRPSRR